MRQTQLETTDYNMTRLKDKFEHLFLKKTNNNDYSSVIEKDYLSRTPSSESQLSTGNKGAPERVELVSSRTSPNVHFTESHVSVNEAYDAFEQEESLDRHCQDLTVKLHTGLREAKDRLMGKASEVFLPKDLIERISRDIVRMSECEPSGIRGCTVYASLERKNETIALCQVDASSETVSTFEVYLTLKEDKKRWYSLRDLLFPVVPGCFLSSFQDEIYLSQGFQLVKKKLYRPN